MPSNICKKSGLASFLFSQIKLKKTNFFKGSRGISPLNAKIMGHRRKKRNRKYTRKVSEEYSKIREMHTRLPGKRGNENRKD